MAGQTAASMTPVTAFSRTGIRTAYINHAKYVKENVGLIPAQKPAMPTLGECRFHQIGRFQVFVLIVFLFCAAGLAVDASTDRLSDFSSTGGATQITGQNLSPCRQIVDR